MKAFLARHPVSSYFALTFAISWGGVLLVIGGLAGMRGAAPQDDSRFPLAVLAMIAGPSVTGLLLTGLIHGREGLREFRSRLLKWRVGAPWYAVALLAAPAVSMAALATLAVVSREFVPAMLVTDGKAARLLLGISVGAAAGFFEELGWTGFAVPHLRTRHGVMATALIIGALWSAWHVLVVVWGIGNRTGGIPLLLFVTLDGLTFLPAFRVLMVWVYDRTESLFVGMLMHASLTACTLILWPATAGRHLLAFDFSVAAAIWVVVAAIAIANSWQITRHPLGRQVA